MIGKLCSAAVVATVLFCNPGFAQTATPAAPDAAAAPATNAPASPSVTGKQARSKECSMEADKQGLHGKARKAFRSKCKSGKA